MTTANHWEISWCSTKPNCKQDPVQLGKELGESHTARYIQSQVPGLELSTVSMYVSLSLVQEGKSHSVDWVRKPISC